MLSAEINNVRDKELARRAYCTLWNEKENLFSALINKKMWDNEKGYYGVAML